MPARRCLKCGTIWPIGWLDCACGGQTVLALDQSSPSKVEAGRLANAMEFEAFYEAREQARIARGEASPEDLGSEDAATIIRLRKAES